MSHSDASAGTAIEDAAVDRESDVPSRMTAVVQSAFGSPDVLERREVAVPTPAADEVLVRIHAAGVNPADWHHVRGDPYVMRLQFGLRAPKVRLRGFDLAGRVAAVGADVRAFELGADVYGCLDFTDPALDDGAFAEYACVPADQLARMPTTLTYAEAASLPLAGLTAIQGLRQGGVEEGVSVLINGASGGVGTLALQIADARGADVTGVCSTRNVDLVQSLGADHVVDYTAVDFAASGKCYDCVIDWVGNRSVSDLRSVLAPDGTLVLSGGGGGGRWIGPLPTMVTATVLDRFVRQDLGILSTKIDAADLDALAELVDDGMVQPVLDQTYPLTETADAIRYVETGRATGKVVVTVD